MPEPRALTVAPREEAVLEGVRRGHRHVLRAGDESHVALELLAAQHVVGHVEHRDARVAGGREDARLDELLGGEAEGAERPRLAGLDEPLGRRERVFQR